MDSSQTPQHSQSRTPQEPPTLHAPLPQSASMPLRTASSTPISSPGLFSPTPSRHNLHLPYTSLSECNTPAPTGRRPWLHPLQTHRVRETHKALIDLDSINGRKTINQYEVIEEIGRGMHGKVKLARNLETGENVAIKIIPRFSKKRRLGKVTALSPQDKTKKEIAILKKIRHRNVVALLEVIDDPELKKIYMVLEHVELGEIVWRKKGLPHICQYERRLVEREMSGGQAPTAEEIQYNRLLERRQAIKEMKRAKMAQHFAGPSDYWSVEHGAADDLGSSVGRWSRISSHDNFANMDRSSSPSGSRHSSVAPSRCLSIATTGLLPSEMAENLSWVDDMETPGPLHSNPASAAAHDSNVLGAFAEESPRSGAAFRERSPSLADSIISHMSSVDYNPYAHDPFAEDYSFVPCFTFDQARTTFRDTVLGLEYLHYQGVVHRDIKPANLLWTRDHRVKISDFGVSYFGRPIRDGEPDDDTVSESEARDFDDDLELAKTVGTPAFFAPELCYTDVDRELQPKVSEQIDVWSLGVTLYCLIFARIPFLAEDEFQMFRKIATEEIHIPRRRLKPVDPSTSPAEHSLYKRQNAHPYRDDNDLDYEDVDNLLYDLLRQMLTKNPEKRIRLRDIKRHPWVVQGIADVQAWLDETDPAGPSHGRKIQVDEKDMSYAVVPLTLLERARSVVKKAVGKVMHPLADRSHSKSRRKRATSSVASSIGDGSIFSKHANVFSQQQGGFERRRSLRGEDFVAARSGRDMVASGEFGQPPPPPPLPPPQTMTMTTVSAATTVHADDPSTYDHLATALRPVEEAPNSGSCPGSSDLSAARAATACSRRFQRHSHQNRAMPQHLQLSHAHHALLETQSTPVTPCAGPRHVVGEEEGGHSTPTRQGQEQGDHRWTGPPSPSQSPSEGSLRSTSIDRGLFMSSDKRQRCSSYVSPVVASGTMHDYQCHPGLMRSVDMNRGEASSRYHPCSPLSSSPQAVSTSYQHGQPQSDSNLQQRHGVAGGFVQPFLPSAPIVKKTSESTSAAADVKKSITTAVTELFAKRLSIAPPRSDSDPEPANLSSPVSPSHAGRGDWSDHAYPSRNGNGNDNGNDNGNGNGNDDNDNGNNTTTRNKLSSISSIDDMGTSWGPSPRDTSRPFRSGSAEEPTEPSGQILVFRSDPSLPALLSGASSVSADMEAELLSRPGRVRRQLSCQEGFSEAVTPPALVKEPAVSPIFKHTPAMESGSLQLHLDHQSGQCDDDDVDSSSPRVEEDDDNDDGIFLIAKSKKKSISTIATPGTRPFANRRRDTGASTASDETAKRVAVSGECSVMSAEP
ncbi:hypothetical protein E4U43_002702 [Claviceps pusilla]|uniref:non-specific serine/threonine protein kinase n=1 Tax=Claviceps pusilla TaxID=123648 RepID=A0A9P7N689_9HYPO|nr:hypothetical protein E4U43_002702 [Claviceps pusilla]